MGYADLLRPPLFPFITSLFFRLGYVSTNTIFVVDGVLFVLGGYWILLLLKLRFNDIESFLGALIYSTFPIVTAVLGCGFSDLASVSFTIWTFYFLVLAVKKNSKFFYLVFPFAMFAFLARYNSALLIFPIALYILMNKDKVNFKDIFIGMFGAFLIVPVFVFFNEKFGNIIYPFMYFFGATSSSGFLFRRKTHHIILIYSTSWTNFLLYRFRWCFSYTNNYSGYSNFSILKVKKEI